MFFSEFSTFYAPASAKHLQTNRRNPFTEGPLSLHSLLSHLGPERNLAVGNLDRLPSVVKMKKNNLQNINLQEIDLQKTI